MERIVPEPIAPLTQDVTDEEVINGEDDKPLLLHETDEGRALLQLAQDYDKREEFVRQAKVLEYRRNHSYWNSVQYLALDMVAREWKTPQDIANSDPQADIDPALYAKVVNIYRAHGEILIGALTSGVPTVRFFPRDADEQEDVAAAKAYTKLAELLQRYNKARLLLMKALFLLYNEGMVAAYNENKADFRFGKIKTPEYSEKEMVERTYNCPECMAELGGEMLENAQAFAKSPMCPTCGVPGIYEDAPTTQKVQTGVTIEPKNRECIEVYGPMNVKIPYWVKDQFSTPHLTLETEEPVGMMREIYPELADKIEGSEYADAFERELRVPTAYRNDFPRNLCTVQRIWFRPWAFNDIGRIDDEAVTQLKAQYPDGCYVVIINKTLVAEIVADKLDDHWTLSENPLSETIHAEPLGNVIIPVQDITNELTNLTLETIEFGIPEVFADPHVLDFDSFQREEARPGQVSPATRPTGQNLASGFHEIKTASLSREVEFFHERIFEMGQFVLGSYPSIYGGAQDKSGGTAREYEISKASALQRLSSTWYIVQEWWNKVIAKSVKSFVQNMREDEQFTKSAGSNFVNVWIRRSELVGEIAEVDPEISEAFPISWAQKRDIFLDLIRMQNEDIGNILRHPENAGNVAAYLGVPELYIPGDDDRNKQLYEIARLIQQEPQVGMPTPFNPSGLYSSVPVDPDLDNHLIEVETCAAWLKSEVGLDAKENNPAGYANVLAHFKEHKFFLQPPAPPSSPDKEEKEDITEEGVANV
jgi:hypothetical protein